MRIHLTRNVTPLGKVLIIKSLGLSNLLYLASVLSVPVEVVKSVDKLIYEFLDCSKYKVKKGVLLAPMEQGGLNVPSFYEMSLASKFTWFRKFFDQSNAKWKTIFSLLLQPNVENSILRSSIDPDNIPLQILNDLPHFYRDCLKVWFSVRSKTIVTSNRHLMWNSMYKIFVSVERNDLNVFTFESASKIMDISRVTTKVVYRILINSFLIKPKNTLI